MALSESAAFLLKCLNEQHTMEEIVDLFLKEYEVDRSTVEKNINEIMPKLIELKLILK